MRELDGAERGGRRAAHVEQGPAHDPGLLHQPGVFAPGEQGIRDPGSACHLENQPRDAAAVGALCIQLHPARDSQHSAASTGDNGAAPSRFISAAQSHNELQAPSLSWPCAAKNC